MESALVSILEKLFQWVQCKLHIIAISVNQLHIMLFVLLAEPVRLLREG